MVDASRLDGGAAAPGDLAHRCVRRHPQDRERIRHGARPRLHRKADAPEERRAAVEVAHERGARRGEASRTGTGRRDSPRAPPRARSATRRSAEQDRIHRRSIGWRQARAAAVRSASTAPPAGSRACSDARTDVPPARRAGPRAAASAAAGARAVARSARYVRPRADERRGDVGASSSRAARTPHATGRRGQRELASRQRRGASRSTSASGDDRARAARAREPGDAVSRAGRGGAARRSLQVAAARSAASRAVSVGRAKRAAPDAPSTSRARRRRRCARRRSIFRI